MRPILGCAVAVCLALAPGAQATVLAPAVIDTAPLLTTDIAIAPDGTGAMVYTKTVGADDRVHLSLLNPDGTWSAPVIVDPDTGDDETAPRVAVGNGGRVLVGYRDAPTTLHYRLLGSAGAALSAEDNIRVAAGAISNDWDLHMNSAGVAYAAWIEFNPGPAVNDARAWRLEGTTGAGIVGGLQKDPLTTGADTTGNGPDIRVGVDPAGNAGISFTQNDNDAWFRRINGTTPSGTFVDTLLPSALGEAISSTYHQHDLELGANGVAWESAQAMFTAGGHDVGVPITGETVGTRVLLDPYPADENDNAERPDVVLNESGRGLYAAEPNQKAGVFGGTLDGATASPSQRLDLSPMEPASIENAQGGIGENGRGLIAWTRDVANGAVGPTEVRARVFDGPAMAPDELLLSDPALGEGSIPVSISFAGDGAGSTRLGDTAVLMEQDQGGTKRVVVGRYDAPPSAPIGTTPEAESTDRPTFTWTAAEAQWSPLTSYKVLVDDQALGTVDATQTAFTPTAALPAGDHTWRVVAVDGLGQETSSPARALPVTASATPSPSPTPAADTTKPKLTVSVKGKRRAGRRLRVRVKATDASGIARVTLRIGKGKPRSRNAARLSVRRKFARGRVRLRASATDRAGNVARAGKRIRIRKKR